MVLISMWIICSKEWVVEVLVWQAINMISLVIPLQIGRKVNCLRVVMMGWVKIPVNKFVKLLNKGKAHSKAQHWMINLLSVKPLKLIVMVLVKEHNQQLTSNNYTENWLLIVHNNKKIWIIKTIHTVNHRITICLRLI